MAEVSGPSPGWVVPVARYAAVVLGGVTALVLAANPATRWFARLRRQDDPDYPDDVPLLFDVNTEATVPTWYSAGLLLAVAAVCVVLAVVARDADGGGARRWVALGLGIYVGGALGLEAVSGVVLDAAGEGLAYAAVTWAEEGAEMVGALVTCCALLAALDVRLHDGAIRVALADTRPRASVAPPHA